MLEKIAWISVILVAITFLPFVYSVDWGIKWFEHVVLFSIFLSVSYLAYNYYRFWLFLRYNFFKFSIIIISSFQLLVETIVLTIWWFTWLLLIYSLPPLIIVLLLLFINVFLRKKVTYGIDKEINWEVAFWEYFHAFTKRWKLTIASIQSINIKNYFVQNKDNTLYINELSEKEHRLMNNMKFEIRKTWKINFMFSILPIFIFFLDLESTLDIFQIGLLTIISLIVTFCVLFPLPSIILSYKINDISKLKKIKYINLFTFVVYILVYLVLFAFMNRPS